ncbi:hypothetical protein [Sphingopyxis terrae]|uniref:hypothetical protein n=1 Tax=Sphingopyxis terrae TaxID=33052 RepID=UPI002A12D713|nr:hypothetical protein [Sphingopyxis terrae]MDX8357763.1 hypothetical protein [Sphingopyxis terrae]
MSDLHCGSSASGPTDPRPPAHAAHWPGQLSASTNNNASNPRQVQSNMIGFQKDGYRLARPIEHGRRMVQNDDNERCEDVHALFAEITALLEDAHEIAARGQNSKLERPDYLKAVEELSKMLDQMRLLSRAIRNAL